MKRPFVIFALAVGLLVGAGAQAQQQKIGHINADRLLQMMPETQKAQKKLEEYGKQLEKDLADMESELDSKVSSFRNNEKMMTSLARQNKTKEIQQLQGRIQEYSKKAQQDLQQKQRELLSPIIDKATKAVKEVARENGYTYVLDSSPSKAVVIFAENGQDLMPAVQEKLGLEGSATTPADSTKPRIGQ